MKLKSLRFSLLSACLPLLMTVPAFAGGKAIDYFPLKQDVIKYLKLIGNLKNGDKMTLKSVYSDTKQEGTTFTAAEILIIKFGEDVAMSKDRTYRVVDDRATLLYEAQNIQGKTFKIKTPADILVMPDKTGKTSWTYKRDGDIYHCVSTFGKITVGEKHFDDCVVVESTWVSEKEKHHTKEYFQKGVGLVRSEVYDDDGNIDFDNTVQWSEEE